MKIFIFSSMYIRISLLLWVWTFLVDSLRWLEVVVPGPSSVLDHTVLENSLRWLNTNRSLEPFRHVATWLAELCGCHWRFHCSPVHRPSFSQHFQSISPFSSAYTPMDVLDWAGQPQGISQFALDFFFQCTEWDLNPQLDDYSHSTFMGITPSQSPYRLSYRGLETILQMKLFSSAWGTKCCWVYLPRPCNQWNYSPISYRKEGFANGLMDQWTVG